MSKGVNMEENSLKESYIGIPPQDILKILLLTKRDNCLEAIESYYKQKNHTRTAPLHIVRARLQSLYLETEAMLKRALSTDEYEKLYESIFTNDSTEASLIGAFRKINIILDEKRITRLDLGKQYDTTQIELENFEKGM